MSGNIFFLGNALLDMSILCDHSLLQKYNMKPDENSEATSEQEPLFEFLLNCPSALLSPGGAAQNSARVAQWVLHSHGKGQAFFAGCVGNDIYGEKLQAFLHESKVKALYHCHTSAPTGITAALVTDDGKRSLCARLGAAELFDKNFLLSPRISSVVQHVDYVYIEGYFASHSPQCALDLAKVVKQLNKQLVVNLSAVYICETYFEKLNSFLSLADIVIGNEQEAMAFVRKHGLPNDSSAICAGMIACLPGHHKPRTVVVTQGQDPVAVCTDASPRIRCFDVPFVKVGDTIGCGDAFAGGFLAMLSLGISMEEAVRYGIYCATCIAQERGCTIPSYDAKKALKF